MLRWLPLLAFALLPVAGAAPIPPGGRAEFGAGGLLTRADLEKVRFASRPVKGDEKGDELEPEKEEEARKPKGDDPAQPRPKNRYDVAVHMPWAKFREGESIPAYFVLRNNRSSELGLLARLDLSGTTPERRGGCLFDVRDRATGKSVVALLNASTNCGGGALVDVPANGFYCVVGDLNRLAGHVLPPGEYEVDWIYGALRAEPVPFSVQKRESAKLVALAKRPALRFYHITSGLNRTEREHRVGEPILWRDCDLDGVPTDALAAALAVGPADDSSRAFGPHGVLVPDLQAVPTADKFVEAWVEWKPYRDGDRVVVTLRAVAPYKEVHFEEVPQLYLQIETPDDEHRTPNKSEKKPDVRRGDVFVTPLTIEARLPTDWREQCGARGTARVAVLVTARRVELPHGRDQQQIKLQLDIRSVRRETPPVWSGIVRTDFTELRFPPQMLTPNPAP